MKKLLVAAAVALLPITSMAQPVLDCSGDAATSWNAIVAQAATDATIRVALVPATPCVFQTRPSAIQTGLEWRGAGLAHSVLIRAYQPSYTTEPFIQFGGGTPNSRGGGLRDLGLMADTYTGGRAILITGVDKDNRAGYQVYDSINVTATGGGNWYRNIDIDGSAIQVSGTQGIRNITIRDSYLFCASDANIYARNAVHLEVRGGSSVIGTGTCGGVGKIRITGDNTTYGNSTDFVIKTKLYGDLVLERCDIGHVSGVVTGNVSIASSCTDRGALVAQVNGTITNSAGWKVPSTW